MQKAICFLSLHPTSLWGWDDPCYIHGTTQSEYALQTPSPACPQATQKTQDTAPRSVHSLLTEQPLRPMGPVHTWHHQLLLSPPHQYIILPGPRAAWLPRLPWPIWPAGDMCHYCWPGSTHVLALCWRPNLRTGHQGSQRQGGHRVTTDLRNTISRSQVLGKAWG